MARINDILGIVRGFSPESATQPDFDDNVGLLVGSESGESEKILVCLDATESVINEAAEAGAKLVLSHHPVIFNAIRKVTDETPAGRAVLAAAKSGISVYSAHTNLDFCENGVNDYNAELFGLKNCEPLEVLGGVGIGRVGMLKEAVGIAELAKKAKRLFDSGYCGYVGGGKVRRIAIINGGGGKPDYILKAKAAGADCYVSSDFAHHSLMLAKDSGINLIIMQHYAMEHIYIKKWIGILNDRAKAAVIKVNFIQARSESNPVRIIEE